MMKNVVKFLEQNGTLTDDDKEEYAGMEADDLLEQMEDAEWSWPGNPDDDAKWQAIDDVLSRWEMLYC
jgi:hypothetical protein